MRTLLLSLFAVAVVQFGPPLDAHACSCETAPDLVKPADGSTSVPRNTIIVASEPGFGVPPTTARVLDAGGDAIAGSTETWPQRSSGDGWTVFTPSSPLEPNATYRVEVNGAVQAAFVTGTAIDALAPNFAGVSMVSARLVTATPSSCWRSDDALDELTIVLDGLDDDVSHVIVEVRDSNETSPTMRVLVPRDAFASPDTIVLATHACGLPGPSIAPTSVQCVTATAYDMAGTGVRRDEVCSPPTSCDRESGSGRCAGRDGCSSSGTANSPVAALVVPLFMVGAAGRSRRRRTAARHRCLTP